MTRVLTALAIGLLCACGSASSGSTTSTSAGSTNATTSGSGGAGTGGGATASSVSSTVGVGGSFGVGGFEPTPVNELPSLTSISFYERTGGTEPTEYVFTVDGTELNTRLDDPLGNGNADITGASGEWYDVYYSDIDGVFQADGSYLTISGVFGQALPAGGGLNLAEIGLHFSDDTVEFGNYVASYVALGDNKNEMSVDRCIDGDLQTHTTMGNTVGATERLRLTLGFASTSGPPPN